MSQDPFKDFVKFGGTLHVDTTGRKVFKNYPMNWQELKKSPRGTDKHSNWGILTGKVNNVTVIDLDTCKETGSFESLDWFESKFGPIDRLNTLTTRTVNGGYHVYFQYTDKLTNKCVTRDKVDLLSDRSCCFEGVGYDVIDSTKPRVLTQDEIHYLLAEPEYIQLPQHQGIVSVTGDAEDLWKILDKLDEKRYTDYDLWTKVGLALKEHPNGLELFRRFSEKSPQYMRDQVNSKWKSYKVRGSNEENLTVASIYHWFKKDGGFDVLSQRFSETSGFKNMHEWLYSMRGRNYVLHPHRCKECLTQVGTEHDKEGMSTLTLQPDGAGFANCGMCGPRKLSKKEAKEYINILNVTMNIVFSEEKKNIHQSMVEKIVLLASNLNLKREKGSGMVYSPVQEWAYIPFQEADDFINENFDSDPELMSQGNVLENLVKYMKSTGNRKFPFLVRDHNYLGFINGVLDKETLEFSAKIPKGKVCWTYFPFEFKGETSTPNFDKVFDFQFEEETRDFIYACLGRTFGIRDNCGFMLYLLGEAGCGKSLVLNVIKRCFGSVGSINESFEKQYGLAYLYNKDLIICDDLPRNISKVLPQETFQSMVTGGQVSTAVKNGAAVDKDWKVPLLFAGNYLPDYIDKGPISRRVMVANFNRTVLKPDITLESKIIETELPAVIFKCLSLYKSIILDKTSGGKGIWQIAPEYFIDEQEGVRRERNPLYKFLGDFTVYNPGHSTSLQEVKERFVAWLGRPVPGALDNGTFTQVNEEYIVVRNTICKWCKGCHIKGCCGQYNRKSRTTRVNVLNLEFIDNPDLEG